MTAYQWDATPRTLPDQHEYNTINITIIYLCAVAFLLGSHPDWKKSVFEKRTGHRCLVGVLEGARGSSFGMSRNRAKQMWTQWTQNRHFRRFQSHANLHHVNHWVHHVTRHLLWVGQSESCGDPLLLVFGLYPLGPYADHGQIVLYHEQDAKEELRKMKQLPVHVHVTLVLGHVNFEVQKEEGEEVEQTQGHLQPDGSSETQ